jgi:hypothetical protein
MLFQNYEAPEIGEEHGIPEKDVSADKGCLGCNERH